MKKIKKPKKNSKSLSLLDRQKDNCNKEKKKIYSAGTLFSLLTKINKFNSSKKFLIIEKK